MNLKKILLIAGPELRHQYYINHLKNNFNIAGIIIESIEYKEAPSQTIEEELAWDWYFTRRREYEIRVFSGSNNLKQKNNPGIIQIPNASINARKTINEIKTMKPDLIAIFGSSIVGHELINLYPQKIFNLHVGLSNWYRGSSCNFWPLYDRRLDLLGASIIRINAGIDSGEILAQQTIDFDENDDEQSLPAKCIILGAKLMIDTIKNWGNNLLLPVSSSGNGKLFLQKQFSPKSVLKVKQMVDKGELKDLVKSQLK